MQFLLSGLIAGVLILGVGGKLSMTLMAYAVDASLNLSIRGIAETLFLGGVIGIAGTFLALPLKKIFQKTPFFQGVILGLLLFFLTLIIVYAFSELTFHNSGIQWLTFAVVALLYTVYGVFMEIILDRSQQI